MKTFIALCLCGLSITASAQLKYSDTKYGVSFQYPKGYDLKEGALGHEDTGMGYLGPTPMEFVAPGGVRVVTIEAPTGSYPGTVSINPYLTNAECEQFMDDRATAPLKNPLRRLVALGFRGFGSALVDWAIKLAGPTITVSQEARVMNLAMAWQRLASEP